eukprot:TRINITY_DN2248_c0_g1_i1.p1 TRINITY_DN2248_c0_g1~~TRINITY_DN2248_c0_g1_i1.p1  ORF type:complete len:416 (+),score=153.86 TRINITY_DN2248_c0_g1_i1:1379-2626(+)
MPTGYPTTCGYPTIKLSGEGYQVVQQIAAEGDAATNPAIRGTLLEALTEALQFLCNPALVAADTEGDGVYVGRGGVAVALRRVLENSAVLYALPADLAQQVQAQYTDIVESLDAKSMRRAATYLEGRAGVHVEVALAGGKNAEAHIVALSELAREVLDLPEGECELLYGRAGYLYALLRLWSTLDARYKARYREIIIRVLRQIEKAGKGKQGFPLMYEWRNKAYLGAAHGVCGVLYVLMQCPKDVLHDASPSLAATVQAATEKLGGLCLESGNYPSSLETGQPGRLNQFCHGSPGFVMLFAKAAEFCDDRGTFVPLVEKSAAYLKDHVQIKGVGLCHGVSGGVYPLLATYRVTRDIKWLQHAAHLALYLAHEYSRMYRYSARPLSLFEGVAGMACLLVDLLGKTPSAAKFPAFDI